MHLRLREPTNNSLTAPLQKYCRILRNLGSITNKGQDRSLPRPTLFTWELSSTDQKPINYDLVISPDPEFHDPLIIKNIVKQSLEVWHLYIATRYFWKVIAKHHGKTLTESPVWSFDTNQATPRWIKVPGITNVRDMGGWPLPGNCIVRQGLIYRGSKMNVPEMDHLQIKDEGKYILIEELGIKTDIDLRMKEEGASPALDKNKVDWINIPIGPYEDICDTKYKENYRKIFQIFAEISNYPIFFHCVAGADRTGTLAFLLNALLGNSKRNLFRDYELTSFSIVAGLEGPNGVYSWRQRRRCSSVRFNKFLKTLALFNKNTDNIKDQVESYLQAIGITKDNIETIRAHLIADGADK